MHLTPLPDDLTVATYVSHLIALSHKTQREIAEEAGFESRNILSMIKAGDTKLPLNRVSTLARALDIDTGLLLRLTLREYMPDTWRDVESLLQDSAYTENEQILLRRFREETSGRDPWPYLVRSERDPNVVTVICFAAKPTSSDL